MKFLFWKKREYPINRDESGRSLRRQAFDLFNQKYRPSQIYKQQLVAASKTTLFRYYEDWKKKKGSIHYRLLREINKRNPDIKQEIVTALSEKLEMPVEEVIMRMGRPWGLVQYLRGQWPNPRLAREQSDIEGRLETALLFIDLATKLRNTPEQTAELLLEITTMTENKKLEITKEGGDLVIKREGKKGSKTIRIPGFKEKIEGLPPPETENVTTVSNKGSEANAI